jgi:hypothetical protein
MSPPLGRVLEHEPGHSFGHVPATAQRIIHDTLLDRAYADSKVENELRVVCSDPNNSDLAKVQREDEGLSSRPRAVWTGGGNQRSRAAQPLSHFGPEDRGYVSEQVNHELTTRRCTATAPTKRSQDGRDRHAEAIREIWNTHPVDIEDPEAQFPYQSRRRASCLARSW